MNVLSYHQSAWKKTYFNVDVVWRSRDSETSTGLVKSGWKGVLRKFKGTFCHFHHQILRKTLTTRRLKGIDNATFSCSIIHGGSPQWVTPHLWFGIVVLMPHALSEGKTKQGLCLLPGSNQMCFSYYVNFLTASSACTNRYYLKVPAGPCSASIDRSSAQCKNKVIVVVLVLL